MPEDMPVILNIFQERNGVSPKDTYMHRVGRAGRFETKGIAISFIANNEERAILDDI